MRLHEALGLRRVIYYYMKLILICGAVCRRRAFRTGFPHAKPSRKRTPLPSARDVVALIGMAMMGTIRSGSADVMAAQIIH